MDPMGIAMIMLVVPMTADAVPAMWPIGVSASAFIFPNNNPKRKKTGIKNIMTLTTFIFKLKIIKE